MLNYLEKFNQLPIELRARISSPDTMAAIKELEGTYGVSLATVVMRVMVGDVSLLDLAKYFVFEYALDARAAERLVDDLKEKVFISVADHVGLAQEAVPAVDAPQDQGASAGEAQLGSWMQERRSEAAVRGSNFFFSPEDEAEVRVLAKKLAAYEAEKPSTQKVPDYDKIVNRVVKEIGISFSSEDMQNRFRTIMTTFLRGIRNKVDTKQAMIKKAESGGLGINEIYADNILALTLRAKEDEAKSEGARQTVDDTRHTTHDTQQPESASNSGDALKQIRRISDEGARDMDYDFNNLPARKNDIAAARLETEKAEPALRLEPSQAETPVALKAAPVVTVEKKEILAVKTQPVLSARKTEGGSKVKMEDVKHVPKLTGPIDELSEMDLVNFRRLDVDPAVRTRRIQEKIRFLEEENYGQRLQGIKAWRKSRVNNLYLEIGKDSIITRKNIRQIIEERRAKGDEYLTEEEFSAVMDLNKSLRY